MSTLPAASGVNFPEAGAWVRQAVDRLVATRLDEVSVRTLMMGRLGMAGVGGGALLETVFVLGADALGLGQETAGPPRCRWIPLDSVVEIEDRDQVNGVWMRIDVTLDSGVRLLLDAPASFIHDLLTVLASLQGVDVGIEEPEYEEPECEEPECEDRHCEPEAAAGHAEGSITAVTAQMEGVSYSSRFESSGTAARATARSWLKDDRRRRQTPDAPSSQTEGPTDAAATSHEDEAGPTVVPGRDGQAASVHAVPDAWRWSAGKADAEDGDGWVDAAVVPMAQPPGYESGPHDAELGQWTEHVAGLSSAEEGEGWQPTPVRTPAAAPTGADGNDAGLRVNESTWQDPAIVWPQPLQGVTYLGGDPAHPKRRRGLFVVFSPAGIRAVAVGYSQFCIDVAWSRVRDVAVETPEELEERTGAKVDPSSCGLVIVGDDATVVFEYRKHSPPATRSALASVLSLVARL